MISRDGFGIFITSGTGNKIVRTAVATGGRDAGAHPGPDRPGRRATSTSPSSPRSSPAAAPASARSRATTRPRRSPAAAPATSPHAAPHHRRGLDERHRPRLEQRAQPCCGGTGQHRRHRDRLASPSTTASSNFPGTLGLPPSAPNTRHAHPRRARWSRAMPARCSSTRPRATSACCRPPTPRSARAEFTPGESATDIDGEDRSAAPTDLGADEYNNAAPTAKIVVATADAAHPRSPSRSTAAVPATARATRPSPSTAGASATARPRRRPQPFVQHTFDKEGDAAVGPHRRRQAGRGQPRGRGDVQARQRHAAGGRDRQAEVQADVPHVHDDDEDRHEERQRRSRRRPARARRSRSPACRRRRSATCSASS